MVFTIQKSCYVASFITLVCLRGGKELRELKPSQFTRGYSPDSYSYVENRSEYHQGTFGNSKDSNKIVTMIATDANPPPKCIVYLLDYTISSDCLSLQKAWTFSLLSLWRRNLVILTQPLPIGKNTLGKLMEDICNEAGIVGYWCHFYVRCWST